MHHLRILLLLLLLGGPVARAGAAEDVAVGTTGRAAPADTADTAGVAGDASLVLERWRVEGDPLVGEQEVIAFLPWGAGDSLAAEIPVEAAALLRTRLVEAGWWAAGVTATVTAGERDEDRRVVTLTIVAGEPVIVGEIGVRGSRVLSRDEILARLRTRPGSTFDRAVFQIDVEQVLRMYSERGYPLARVYPSRFRRTEEGRLGFDLRIGEGPAAAVETVRVFGADHTDPRVVARIAGVRAGDDWNLRRIEAMSGRLRRDGLFTSVSEPRIVKGSRDNLLGVEISVEEAPSNSFFGVLGYNRNAEGEGEVVGLVDVDLRNMLGTARRARFRFSRQARNVRDLSFRYREPWVFSTPISLEVGAAQALRDSLFSRTDLDLALSIPLGDRSRGTLAAERRDSATEVAPDSTLDETSTGGSLGFVADWRDRRINPGRGFWTDSRLGVRVTEADVQRTRFETENQIVVPVAGNLLVSLRGGFRGAWSTDDLVPLYEQYYFGGTNTVRGYNEEQFHGEQIWWVRNELRWRTSLRSRIYGFGDVGGYRFRTPVDPFGFAVTRDVIFGYGFGMALESRTGIVRFELALGEGDTFSDAKVHVGLEQEF